MQASKQTLQASVPSVHCLQINEKPRDKMRIGLGRSTTHGRLRTFALKSSYAQIFSKLSLQVENDKIRLKT